MTSIEALAMAENEIRERQRFYDRKAAEEPSSPVWKAAAEAFKASADMVGLIRGLEEKAGK